MILASTGALGIPDRDCKVFSAIAPIATDRNCSNFNCDCYALWRSTSALWCSTSLLPLACDLNSKMRSHF
ncbi:hypothetical protein PN499_18805 [Kamptonema animale CS-326]|uniref:hypothetical protein n=1 Tax=Kamptonema animale TaxID=92934 RepID=UPI00232C85B8|nr:hypothetical protein [Kamptonema animale]MDB9513247.1 hypothetical protein [Kamptonema animale CS-326]